MYANALQHLHIKCVLSLTSIPLLELHLRKKIDVYIHLNKNINKLTYYKLKLIYPWQVTFKGIVHPKMKILSVINHPHVFTNP